MLLRPLYDILARRHTFLWQIFAIFSDKRNRIFGLGTAVVKYFVPGLIGAGKGWRKIAYTFVWDGSLLATYTAAVIR